MKTLWQRLSKKNKNKLKAIKLKYPALIGSLIETLKEKNAWTELNIYEANTLLVETNGKDLSINNLYDLFNDK